MGSNHHNHRILSYHTQRQKDTESESCGHPDAKGKEGRILGKSISETQARERGIGKSWEKTTSTAYHSEVQQSSLGIISLQDAR